MDFTPIQTAAVAIFAAAGPAVMAYFKNVQIKDIIAVMQNEAQTAVTYMRITADGTVTVEERVEMGDLALRTWGKLEEITGAPIINKPTVPWILPAGAKPIPTSSGGYPSTTYETAVTPVVSEYTLPGRLPRKMTDESFNFIMASLPDSEREFIRKQVDAAEAAQLWEYPLETSRRRLLIRDGMLAGDFDIWEPPRE